MRKLIRSYMVVAAVTGALCLSCGAPSIRQVRSSPDLEKLPIESVITTSDSLLVSSVVSTPSCDILLSEVRLGGIVRVRPNGVRGNTVIATLTDTYQGAQLEEYTDDASLVWSRSSSTLGLVDHESLTVQPLSIPLSDWGLPVIGSITGVLERWMAVAYLGDGPPVPQPEPWVRAPLVRLVDEQGHSLGTLGTLDRQPGRYLSWLLARSVLGSYEGYVSALFLSTGNVTTFAISNEGYETDRSEYSLPIYIASPHPLEELWTPEWIQIGGDVAHLIEVSQVIAADFKSDGGVIAVRPYMAEWRRVRNRFGPTQGMWEVTSRGLEAYSADGMLEQAFSLPSPTVGRVSVDRHNRIFLFDGAGDIYVSSVFVRDKERACPLLPPLIEIEAPRLSR